MGKYIESELIKVKAPKRAPGSILRRTDFKEYLNGHGTFYRFDEDHFPNDLLDKRTGDRLSLILYNLHTDQLDEVIFKLRSRFEIGKKCVWFRGVIEDIDSYFEIKIVYRFSKPLKSYILVFASAPPDYSYLSRP